MSCLFVYCTYDECKEKLVTMYEPETNKTAERYRFRKMKQAWKIILKSSKTDFGFKVNNVDLQIETIKQEIRFFECKYKKLRRALKHGWNLKEKQEKGH